MATATTTRPKRVRKPATALPADDQQMTFGDARPHSLASVPSGVLARYIRRTVDGNVPDFDVLKVALRRKQNVLIEGPTGPGKTMFVRAFAELMDMPFYAIPSNGGAEPSQLFGKYIPNDAAPESDDNGLPFHIAFVWVDGPVTEIVRHGGVLLINEANFMPERLSTTLFGLTDDRRHIALLDHKGEIVQAHPDTLIVADMNPDYEGTRRLNKAFRNRFAHQLVWDYDPAVEAQLVKAPALLTMATDLRLQHKKQALSTPTTTNALMEFELNVTDLGIDYAMVNFANRYTEQERSAVLTVCKTYRDSIMEELTEDDPEDMAAEWDALRA